MEKMHLMLSKKKIIWLWLAVCSIYLLFCIYSCSTSTEGFDNYEGIKILSTIESNPLTIQDVKVCDSKTVQVTLSKSASFKEAYVIENPPLDKDKTVLQLVDGPDSIRYGVTTEAIDKNIVSCKIDEPMVIGRDYIFYARINDSFVNTKTFAVSFKGYNDHMAKLIINELRTTYSGNTKNPEKTKVEYIELRVLQAGNLSGLQLYSAIDGEDLSYVFPAIEVKQGEYITVHYRPIPTQEDKCIDELGKKLSLCSLQDCNDSARDLWQHNNTKAVLGKAEDVIVLKDTATGNILDGLLYSEHTSDTWKKATVATLAQEVFEAGLWQGSSSPQDALNATGNTATRTLSRLNTNIPSSKTDWIITKTSGATPGATNCKVAYVPTKK